MRFEKKSLDLFNTHQERHGHECGWRPVRQHPAVVAAVAPPPADRWPARQRLPAAVPALAAHRTPGDGTVVAICSHRKPVKNRSDLHKGNESSLHATAYRFDRACFCVFRNGKVDVKAEQHTGRIARGVGHGESPAASSGESGTMSEEEEAGGAPPPLPASASWIDGNGTWE